MCVISGFGSLPRVESLSEQAVQAGSCTHAGEDPVAAGTCDHCRRWWLLMLRGQPSLLVPTVPVPLNHVYFSDVLAVSVRSTS
jgi:hypothetical protein